MRPVSQKKVANQSNKNVIDKSDPLKTVDTNGTHYKKLLSAIQELNDIIEEKCVKVCEDVLLAIYQQMRDFGIIYFSEEQKLKIGSTLGKAVDKIFTVLFELSYDFDPLHAQAMLIYRSALQFILDDFSSFPINEEGDPLKQILDKEIEESDTIYVFDKALDFWKEIYTVALGEVYSMKDLCKSKEIPENHTWWFGKGKK
ncbi:hypothetical protein Btru_075577 [Bulinus truncatus]|nr:hypothetical protein Btru_075577 [Bulinus truncatus]